MVGIDYWCIWIKDLVRRGIIREDVDPAIEQWTRDDNDRAVSQPVFELYSQIMDSKGRDK